MSAIGLDVAMRFFLRHWRAIGLAAIIAALSLQTARLHHAKADLTAAQLSAADWKRRAGEWEASFHQAEQLRRAETQSAITAVSAAEASCTARVAEARRSATAIHTIVKKEPAHDPNGCPVRELVPAERLRDALQPAAR